MAVCNGWLLSGGAEHDFRISKKFVSHQPIRVLPWSTSFGLKYQLLPSLNMLEIVERKYDSSGQVIPSKLIGISTKSYVFEQSSLSPAGNYIVASTCKSLKLYSLKKLDNGIVASKLSRIDDPGVVSAIVAGEKHVYFATNDFVVRKFDYTSKTEKTIYKDDQEVSVRKLMLSSDEKTLVAVTHRNEIIFLNAEDENPSDDSVQKVKVSHPIIDCRWNEPFGLILLLAHSEQPLCLLNDGNFLYFPSIGLENEYPVAISDVIERRMIVVFNTRNVVVLEFDEKVTISDVIERRMIVVSNTRNVMVLEFDEKLSYLNKFEATTPLAVVAADAVKAVDNEANKSSRLNRFIENSRLGPQWALLPKDAEDAAKATTGTRQVRTRSQERRLSTGQQDEPIFGRQRIFLCGTQPAAPPTQVPYVIKRYGRT
uniref:Uncharacterized protein n=1 Tax=Panagrolaimus sp. JU765 TaxID=591449 RepID=A0AC34Q1U9_9BILA